VSSLTLFRGYPITPLASPLRLPEYILFKATVSIKMILNRTFYTQIKAYASN
jgi:hypothetical protein